MEEIFDIYTRDGKHIGTAKKSECHSPDPGFYHKTAWVWIVNDKKEILIQKRAPTKKNIPNKWDMSAAGHIISGETPVAGAMRETREELGLDLCEDDFTFVREFIYDEGWEIGVIFLVKIDYDIDKTGLQKEEVADIRWVDEEQFEKTIYSDDFAPFGNDYKDWTVSFFKSIL